VMVAEHHWADRRTGAGGRASSFDSRIIARKIIVADGVDPYRISRVNI